MTGTLAPGPTPESLSAAGTAAVDRMLTDEQSYHVVQTGESLSSIAENVLQDRAAWLTLWHLNQNQVPHSDRLRVGTRLVLPTNADLVAAGRPIGGAPNGGTAAAPTKAGGKKEDTAGGSAPTSQARALLLRHGELIRSRSAQLGIEPAIAAAIVLVESSGSGILDGRTVIRFEPRIFRQLSKHVVSDSHANQDAEYAALAHAVKLDEDAAYRSISMGAGQIMGFNAESLDYANAKAMLTAFASDEGEQVSAMLQFIANNPRLVTAARDKKWTAFARIYNGPKQRGYDKKLSHAYVAATAAVNDLGNDTSGVVS
ncbi:MAG: N-acetylmuramidase domain-containing protein [Polyangia bacterium]